jgi:hypothetical protein
MTVWQYDEETCSELHSFASWPSGRAYTYEGRENVVKKKELSRLDCDRIEEIAILFSFIDIYFV